MILSADCINLLSTEKDESALQHKIKNVTKKLEIWFQNNNLMINTAKITETSVYIK
jgi:hypothetical protein